jgi:hypothetical protein
LPEVMRVAGAVQKGELLIEGHAADEGLHPGAGGRPGGRERVKGEDAEERAEEGRSGAHGSSSTYK